MRILFASEFSFHGGSTQAVFNYHRIAAGQGCEIRIAAQYGACDPRVGDLIPLCEDARWADHLILVFEATPWLAEEQIREIVQLFGRERITVIDADGRYGPTVSVDGDSTHAEYPSAFWRTLYEQLSDRILQPRLSEPPPNVRFFPFYGMEDPPWRYRPDRQKNYAIQYVGNNWYRWKAVSDFLAELEPIRGRIGRIALKGQWWDGTTVPGYERWTRADVEFLRRHAVETEGPVPFCSITDAMSEAVISPIFVRPALAAQQLVIPRFFETVSADTIPIVGQDAAYISRLYGGEALELCFDRNLPELVSNILTDATGYERIVRMARHRAYGEYNYHRLLGRLLELLGTRSGGGRDAGPGRPSVRRWFTGAASQGAARAPEARGRSAGSTRTQLWGIMMVRNEADIIAANVRHHLAHGVDRLLVVDNGSSDGTDRVLAGLSRGGRLYWKRHLGAYHQAQIMTELAREAFLGGAAWVLPIDADEFWCASGGDLRDVLEDSKAGALQADIVNFIQRREQREAAPDALWHMTRRCPEPAGPLELTRELVEGRRIGFVEMMYPPKWVSRASLAIEIAYGNHSVMGVDGPYEKTAAIVCLHAPLRARSVLEAQGRHGRRLEGVVQDETICWHWRRWRRIAEEDGLEDEWRANSYADDCLDVYGAKHPVVFDPRLRDVVAPWIEHTPGDRGDSGKASRIWAAGRAGEGVVGSATGALAAASVRDLVACVASVVGPGRRVLVAGRGREAVIAGLRGGGYYVAAAATPDEATAAPVAEGGAPVVEVREALDREPFDVVVLTDAAEPGWNPGAALAWARSYVGAEGCVAVPVGTRRGGWKAVEEAFDAAGWVVSRMPREGPSVALGGEWATEREDEDEGERAFVAVGYPVTGIDDDRLRQRLRAVMGQREAAERDLSTLGALAARLERQEEGIAFLRSLFGDELARRDRRIRALEEALSGQEEAARVAGGHERLLAEYEIELRRLREQLAAQTEARANLEAQLTEITGSTSWAAARLMARLRLSMAPRASRREKVWQLAVRGLRRVARYGRRRVPP